MEEPSPQRSVLVTGARDWPHYGPIFFVLKTLHDKHNFDILIEGGASGADRYAAMAAKRIPYKRIETVRAKWTQYMKAAGPIRNKHMLTEYHPNLVVGFHDYLPASKGTKDCLDQAMTMHIPTVLISSKLSNEDITALLEGALSRASG